MHQVSVSVPPDTFGMLEALQALIGLDVGGRASKSLVIRTLIAQEFERRNAASSEAPVVDRCAQEDEEERVNGLIE